MSVDAAVFPLGPAVLFEGVEVFAIKAQISSSGFLVLATFLDWPWARLGALVPIKQMI